MMPENLEHAIIEGWNKFRKPGDAKKLAEIANCSTQTIYNAFNQKKYSQRLFEVMREFYSQRINSLNEAYNQINPK